MTTFAELLSQVMQQFMFSSAVGEGASLLPQGVGKDEGVKLHPIVILICAKSHPSYFISYLGLLSLNLLFI